MKTSKVKKQNERDLIILLLGLSLGIFANLASSAFYDSFIELFGRICKGNLNCIGWGRAGIIIASGLLVFWFFRKLFQAIE